MAKQKTNNFIEVFKIFFSSIKTYFLYLDKSAKYMAFPIFGQIISIFILFSITYYFNTNIENIRALSPFFQDDSHLYGIFWVVLFPFILVLIKAVYDYIIAFEALNIMFYTISPNKKTKDIDFKSYNKAIERRLFGYIVLMLIVTLLLVVPPLLFISPIMGLFLCLSFQVHALENDSSPFDAIIRSFKLVSKNVIPTIIMLVLCYIVTYWFLPELFVWAFDKISVTHFFINISIPFIDLLPISAYNEVLQTVGMHIDSVTIAKYIVEGVIAFILVGFTLPFRCCCFTKLYRVYDSENIKEYSKESEEIIKRASGKKRKN